MEVIVSGRSVDIGPPQRRAVLAALTVDAGRPVPTETLIDRVWGEHSPDRVRRALQAHITRIRRLLEPDGRPAPLVRRPAGYLLDVDPDAVDLHRFRRLLDRVHEAELADAERVMLLREALGLWRGTPLAGVIGQWAARTLQTWQQLHLDTAVAWGRAELAVDRPTAVIGPLTELVGEHPLTESVVAVLMRALHEAGRASDALDLFTATRTRLVDELGIEPGAELQRVQRAVLRDDRGQPERKPAARTVPAQLPRDIRGFSGRGDELARLDALAATPGGTAMVITTVVGTAGVGKTALALHWAHRNRSRFPDGQFYVNLRGYDPAGQPMDPADAIRGFLDALGVPPDQVPPGRDARAALYRSLLDGRRVLVVLDNARDAEQVRPLLPGTPSALVLVTSRSPLAGLSALDGAVPVALDLLTTGDARDLLTHRLGAARLAAEPQAADDLIARCARLPLALAVVAARAAARPRLTLATLAAELADTASRLDALSVGDPLADVRGVFSWSYAALSPAAGQLFRLLGLHPGPDITAAAAASLAGLTPGQVRPTLTELVRAHLVTEHTPGRYTPHDLLRSYALEQAQVLDGASVTPRFTGCWTTTCRPGTPPPCCCIPVATRSRWRRYSRA